MSKLNLNRTVSKDIGLAPYLLSNQSKYTHSIYSKLRYGVLKLKIEIGRYHSISRENRFCDTCVQCST